MIVSSGARIAWVCLQKSLDLRNAAFNIDFLANNNLKKSLSFFDQHAIKSGAEKAHVE